MAAGTEERSVEMSSPWLQGTLFIEGFDVSRKPGGRGVSWKPVMWWKPPVSCTRRLRICYYLKNI
jgi:hypothetical protein